MDRLQYSMVTTHMIRLKAAFIGSERRRCFGSGLKIKYELLISIKLLFITLV